MRLSEVQSKVADVSRVMLNEPLAHITEDGRAHLLREHLFRTAERAADFASVFGFRQWGWLGGLWHDLGKYSKAFQNRQGTAADERPP